MSTKAGKHRKYYRFFRFGYGGMFIAAHTYYHDRWLRIILKKDFRYSGRKRGKRVW